jgi:hypothetical protein
MKTSTLARVGLTVALALGAVGCGHPPHTAFGNVELLATVPSDVLVDTLDFRISDDHSDQDGGSTLVSGRIHTRHPQEEFAQLITHVPAGEAERIDVDSKSTDGQRVCTGSVPLIVKKGMTTRVHVALTCRGVNDGIVHITVGVVSCPQTPFVSYTISPLSASVGASIDVAAIDQDADAGVLSYSWTATTGTFADPSAAATTYRCASAGPVTMTLVVMSNGCEETHTIGGVMCSPGTDAGD